MKALKEGFTTGACAAAAALGSCLWQRDGTCPAVVEIVLPKGQQFCPEIVPLDYPSCGVVKNAGDDPDATHGMMVVANVRILDGNGTVRFVGGEGVGYVTQHGLKVAAGEPAINPMPRRMIEHAVRQVFPDWNMEVTISIPGGEEVSKRTFNPRLGIEGGLSILGTTGIVRPMSEDALTETIFLSLRVLKARGAEEVILTFGNQGEAAIAQLLPDREDHIVQMSNYVGFALDTALELKFARVLVVGHPGKLVKVAAGVMNTHSRVADVRMEPIIAHLALMEASIELVRAISKCLTTDAAIELIHEAGFDSVWAQLAQSAARACARRVRSEMCIQTVMLGSDGQVLGGTSEWNL